MAESKTGKVFLVTIANSDAHKILKDLKTAKEIKLVELNGSTINKISKTGRANLCPLVDCRRVS